MGLLDFYKILHSLLAMEAHSKKGRFISKKEQIRRQKVTDSIKNKKAVGDNVNSKVITIGRRIIDIGLLSKQVDVNGCSFCHSQLRLQNTITLAWCY